MQLKCNYPLYWNGCYKGSYDLWHPDSYSHPAKMSVPLAFRIMAHLKEIGLLKDTDTILDPMSGIGTTGVVAGALGFKFIGVELEEKFIGFQKQNKEYASRKLYKDLDWQILQGDSRNLSSLLRGEGLKVVTSPPYSNQKLKVAYDVHVPITGDRRSKGTDALQANIGYQSEGQIGALADKPLKSITSPPYDDMLNSSSQHGNTGIAKDNPKLADTGRYGANTQGQIGNEKQESYLQAMSKVYVEIAKVSDVLCVVVKNPTRNGKLRRLDLDTIELLKQSGWTIHCQHQALLFEELEQGDLFNGSQRKIKGRMSFFKRLSWQNGQPVAAWEDVIIAVRKYDTPDKR